MICIRCDKIFSQNHLSFGLYKGGKALENSVGKGYYFFDHDSTFTFIGLSNTKDTYSVNDTIKIVGRGRWNIKDAFLQLQFDNSELLELNTARIDYQSYTAAPYDSIRIAINVTNKDPLARNVFFVGSDTRKFGETTDTSGKLILRLPFNYEYATSLLEITHPKYITQSIPLFPGNNFHTIKVFLSPKENGNSLLATGHTFFKLSQKNKKYFFVGNDLLRSPKEYDFVISLLQNNAFVYPLKVSLLRDIEKLLSKKNIR